MPRTLPDRVLKPVQPGLCLPVLCTNKDVKIRTGAAWYGFPRDLSRVGMTTPMSGWWHPRGLVRVVMLSFEVAWSPTLLGV